MTTMIEKLLARMAAYRDELEVKLDGGTSANIGPSAFASIGNDSSVTTLMAAAAADNATRAAARLRTLHEPARRGESAREPAHSPKPPMIIDAEYTEITVEKDSNDTA